MKVLVFDFDGVLRIPFSMPPSPFPHTIALLNELYNSPNTYLLLASFNHDACRILIDWQVDHMFLAMRYGSNHSWNPPFDTKHNDDMEKSQQIGNMLQELKLQNHQEELYFFDDLESNIADVQLMLPYSKPILVSSLRGVTMSEIENSSHDVGNKNRNENDIYTSFLSEIASQISNDIAIISSILHYSIFTE